MALLRASKQKRLKLLLISAILFIFGIIFAVFIYRQTPDLPSTEGLSSEEGTNIAIGRVRQTATKDGHTEWSLDAATVKYMESEKKALFKDISVTFFLKDGGKVFLTADAGTLKTESKDIEVTGDVVVKNEDYLMESESLRYQHEKRLLFAKVPVKITGKDFDLVADSLSVDLNNEKAWFKGNVKGNVNEKAAF
jgi:LPS export ABC transporter protein LptC